MSQIREAWEEYRRITGGPFSMISDETALELFVAGAMSALVAVGFEVVRNNGIFHLAMRAVRQDCHAMREELKAGVKK